MIPIWRIGECIFILDQNHSDKYASIYLAQHNCKDYRIRIDTTTIGAYYELYRDYYVNERKFADRLFATGKREKMESFIKDFCKVVEE